MKQLDQQLFGKMGEISNDGMFIYSPSTRQFNYFNTSFLQLFNFTPNELNGDITDLVNLIHPEDTLHAIYCYEECLADQTHKKYELRFIINGMEKYFLFSLYPLVAEGEVLLHGIVADTTSARHNKIHIEQINAHKNIALEVLSHDLKEPLGLMRLTASAMEEEAVSLGSETLVDSVSFIKEMCERNIKLVRSIINKEFLKSAVIELKKERTDLVWEIQDVVRYYRRSHLRTIKEFRFNTAAAQIYLQLDGMKFLQVINNLISNAIKFTAIGGVIEVSIQDQPQSVMISVADNGIGIAPHLQQHLFERGKQGLKPGLSGEESGGLGMSIIKTIVELHGGILRFISQQGVGTTFYIELPK